MAASMHGPHEAQSQRQVNPVASVLGAISHSSMNVYDVQWDKVAGTILNSTDEKIEKIAPDLIKAYGSIENVLREIEHLKMNLSAVAQHLKNKEPLDDNDLQRKIFDCLSPGQRNELTGNIQKITQYITERECRFTEKLLQAEARQPVGNPSAVRDSYVSLKDKILCKTVQSRLNIYQIPCLNQTSMQGGGVSCGYHAVKNALGALATIKDFSIDTTVNVFDDKFISDNMESNLLLLRGKEEIENTADISEIELRAGWNAVLEGKIHPFPNAKAPLSWNRNELSLLYVRDNHFVINDHDSLETLANLKELSKKEGPCYHAFIAGDHRHWVTIIYEKGSAGQVSWYCINSENNKPDLFNPYITLISEAMEKIDTIAPGDYYERFGKEIERLSQLTESDEDRKNRYVDKQGKPIFLPTLVPALDFMEKMCWLDNPEVHPLVGNFIDNLRKVLEDHQKLKIEDPRIAEMLKRISEKETASKEIDSGDLRIALLELQFPNTAEAQSALAALRNMTELTREGKEIFLNIIMKCDISERVNRLKQIITLQENGFSKLLKEMIIPKNLSKIEENCKTLFDLVTLKLLPPPSYIRSVIDSFEAFLVGNLRLYGTFYIRGVQLWLTTPFNSKRRRKMILSLTRELYANPDPKQVRTLAKAVMDNLLLFKPLKQGDPNFEDELFKDLNFVAGWNLELTTDARLARENNSYHIYEKIAEKRKDQVCEGLPFKIDSKVYRLQLPKKQPIYYRKDIPPGLDRSRLRSIFIDIERRMESDSLLCQAFYELTDEYVNRETYSPEKSKELFRKLKKNFFEDQYIQSITNLPEDQIETISRATFYFYSLFESWLKGGSIPKDEHSLSEQEVQLLCASMQIDRCDIGKDRKIASMYRDLVNTTPELANRDALEEEPMSAIDGERRKRILKSFEPLLTTRDLCVKRIRDLLENEQDAEALAKDLLGHPQTYRFDDSTHIRTYIMNRFGMLTGVYDPLTFDWYWHGVPEKLRNMTDSEFMTTFLYHVQRTMIDVPGKLNEALADLDKKIVESEKAPGTHRMEYRLSADIVEFTGMNSVDIFNVKYADDDVDEYYPIITGIKDRSALLEKLGIVIEKSPVLDLNLIKQKFPVLNIIDAEFWESVGGAVDEEFPFENESIEVQDWT